MKPYKVLMAAAVSALNLGLIACTSNGDGGLPGAGGAITTGGTTSGTSGGTTSGATGGATGGTTSGTTGGAGGGLTNDGTTPTDVTENGTALTGRFICTVGARAYGNVTTQVGSGGLVGGPLTTLLDSVGATTVTALLNSISEPNNVIDGNLDTFATVSLTAGGLGVLDSVDESVVLPAGQSVPAGKFAVFGVSFPSGTANLSLINSLKVSTFSNGVLQESNTLTQNALTLLVLVGGSTPRAAYVGLKATHSYDIAQISLTPGVLTANVGDAMHFNELCTDGELVAVPTP